MTVLADDTQERALRLAIRPDSDDLDDLHHGPLDTVFGALESNSLPLVFRLSRVQLHEREAPAPRDRGRPPTSTADARPLQPAPARRPGHRRGALLANVAVKWSQFTRVSRARLRSATPARLCVSSSSPRWSLHRVGQSRDESARHGAVVADPAGAVNASGLDPAARRRVLGESVRNPLGWPRCQIGLVFRRVPLRLPASTRDE